MKMKYVLFADTNQLFAVPKKHWKYIDIINSNSKEYDDNDVNDAITFIKSNCKVKLTIHAISQFL